MSPSFDFREPDRFTTGAVGPPGQRVFYLQAAEGSQVATLKLEKQQVIALADYLERVLSDLPPVEPDRSTGLELVEPLDPAWVVGPLGVAYDERDDRVVLVAEELLTDEDHEPDDGASARFYLDRDQVASFIDLARQLVEAGRPPCVLCGLPMDPDGHVCPRSN